MARSVTHQFNNPDPTYINLCRLLARLENQLLSPDNAPNLAHSSYARVRTGTNIEYARSLLLRLEHDSSSVKIQSRKQTIQADLQAKRDQIKRLNQRLRELNDLAVDSDEEEDEEHGEGDREFEAPSTLNGQAPLSVPGDDGVLNGEPPPTTATAATLRSRHAQTSTSPAKTTSSSLFPPNFNPPTNVDPDPNLSQTEALLSHNRREQENLTDSLLDLVSQFKASAIQFQSSLESDKDVMTRATSGLDKNATGMEAAGRRMGTLRKMTEGKGWFARLKIYGLIALLWVVALVIVFVLPKLRF